MEQINIRSNSKSRATTTLQLKMTPVQVEEEPLDITPKAYQFLKGFKVSTISK
jgi:hypothetical protein